MLNSFKTRLMLIAFTTAAAFVLNTGARAEEKDIAVVNVSDVFARYDKVKVVQDKILKEFDAQHKSLQERERKLKTWKESLDDDAKLKNPQKDKVFFAETLKFQQAMFDFQNEYAAMADNVEERRKNEMKGVLSEIRKAIELVGKQEKCKLIMRSPDYMSRGNAGPAAAAALEEKMNSIQLVQQFRENPVLFFASGVDFTDKVVELLNEDFKKQGSK